MKKEKDLKEVKGKGNGDSELSLADTVDGMLSDNYKERFVAEYVQLSVRIKKLKAFVGKIKYAKYAGVEEPKHDCPLDLLEKQLTTMMLYRMILELRAEKYENIKLPDVDKENE